MEAEQAKLGADQQAARSNAVGDRAARRLNSSDGTRWPPDQARARRRPAVSSKHQRSSLPSSVQGCSVPDASNVIASRLAYSAWCDLGRRKDGLLEGVPHVDLVLNKLAAEIMKRCSLFYKWCGRRKSCEIWPAGSDCCGSLPWTWGCGGVSCLGDLSLPQSPSASCTYPLLTVARRDAPWLLSSLAIRSGARSDWACPRR